jgi:hypothetical protein
MSSNIITQSKAKAILFPRKQITAKKLLFLPFNSLCIMENSNIDALCKASEAGRERLKLIL